jgi:Fe-S-cluster containining protein
MNKVKKLLSIYAKIPDIECKGLCHPSCTIVPAAKIEVKRARERMGGKNPFNPLRAMMALKENISEMPPCSALKDKRCSIYHARPAICRLYGVAEGLDCPFGCLPKRKLTKREAHDLIREIEAL